jgi:choline dehydrogenase
LKQEAERRLAEWQTTGRGLASSSLVDAVVFCSTGLGDLHSHDTEIMFFVTGGNDDIARLIFNIDIPRYFDDVSKRLAPDSENLIVIPNPVLPHSEGEIVLDSADPGVQPAIRMNYYDDPRDMKVMVAAIRRSMDIAANWPGNRKPGPLMMPPFLAESTAIARAPSPATRYWKISPCTSR